MKNHKFVVLCGVRCCMSWVAAAGLLIACAAHVDEPEPEPEPAPTPDVPAIPAPNPPPASKQTQPSGCHPPMQYGKVIVPGYCGPPKPPIKPGDPDPMIIDPQVSEEL